MRRPSGLRAALPTHFLPSLSLSNKPFLLIHFIYSIGNRSRAKTYMHKTPAKRCRCKEGRTRGQNERSMSDREVSWYFSCFLSFHFIPSVTRYRNLSILYFLLLLHSPLRARSCSNSADTWFTTASEHTTPITLSTRYKRRRYSKHPSVPPSLCSADSWHGRRPTANNRLLTPSTAG